MMRLDRLAYVFAVEVSSIDEVRVRLIINHTLDNYS